ncbi:MAG: flagellar hook-length control protein FliK [Acetobacteraceae bacterium]
MPSAAPSLPPMPVTASQVALPGAPAALAPSPATPFRDELAKLLAAMPAMTGLPGTAAWAGAVALAGMAPAMPLGGALASAGPDPEAASAEMPIPSLLPFPTTDVPQLDVPPADLAPAPFAPPQDATDPSASSTAKPRDTAVARRSAASRTASEVAASSDQPAMLGLMGMPVPAIRLPSADAAPQPEPQPRHAASCVASSGPAGGLMPPAGSVRSPEPPAVAAAALPVSQQDQQQSQGNAPGQDQERQAQGQAQDALPLAAAASRAEFAAGLAVPGASEPARDAPRIAADAGVTRMASGPASPAAQMAPALAQIGRAPDGAERLTLRLDPPELGHVQIRIDRPPQAPARVEIIVEKADTLILLLRDQPQLLRALDQAGVPAEGRSITFHIAPPETVPRNDPSSLPAPQGNSTQGNSTQGNSTQGSSAQGSLGGGGASGDGSHGAARQDPQSGRQRGGQPDGNEEGFSPVALAGWLRGGLDITA